MKLLLIGHMLGDFYFQTDNMVEKKKKSFKYILLHCLMYSVVMISVLILASGEYVKVILPTLIVGVLHIGIDSMKAMIQRKYVMTAKEEGYLFAIDQIIHIILLFVVSNMCIVEVNIGWIPGISDELINCINNASGVMGAILLCGKPAAVIVELVFNMIPKTIINAEMECSESNNMQKNICEEGLKIGTWIGIFEREIILILGVLGQYSAIGFVLAAKSLARHSQFSNKAFAEKYLVGTLLSALIALIGILMCN